MAPLRLGEGGLWRGENFRPRLTTASAQCLRVSEQFFILTAVVLQTNTFQAVLITDGWLSFAMLNYGNLTWTTGILSGGDPNYGLGGTAALVGINSHSVSSVLTALSESDETASEHYTTIPNAYNRHKCT